MSGFNVKWLVVAILFTTVIIFLTHLPMKQSHSGLLNKVPPALAISRSGAVEHILAYGMITFLFILSFRISPTMLSVLLLFFAILAVGAVDELTQPFFSRYASLADWTADIVGIVAVLLCSVCFKNSKHKTLVNADI